MTMTDGGGAVPGSDAGQTMSGGLGIGEACTSDDQCTDPPDATCFRDVENPFTGNVEYSFPNGFCSKPCEESEECGSNENAACASLSSSGGGGGTTFQFCTVGCSDPSGCRTDEGYQCMVLFGGFGFCTP